MKIHQKLLRKLDRECDVVSGRHLAIARRGSGEAIAVTTNRRGGDGVGRWTTHAEAHLLHKLRKMKIDARGLGDDITIEVYRVRKNGDVAYSHPCEDCTALLRDSGYLVKYTNPHEAHGWSYL